MFYLAGNDFPRSARELASALRESLQTFLTLTSDEDRTVRIEGGNYPDVDSVRVDLSEANVNAGQIPRQPVGVGKSCSGLQALKLGICAHPLRVQGIEIHFDLTAVRAAFEVRGQLEVDDGFNARLSHLSCEGSGPMGTLAGRLMEIYLARFNNLEVPLMAISLGNIPMQDLQIEVSDFLKVKAAFRGQGVSRRRLRD